MLIALLFLFPNPIVKKSEMVYDKYLVSDYIFSEKQTTKSLYEEIARPIVRSCVQGMNGTIFAYGQTSSGKTHTMIGTKEEPGVALLTLKDIFEEISKYLD